MGQTQDALTALHNRGHIVVIRTCSSANDSHFFESPASSLESLSMLVILERESNPSGFDFDVVIEDGSN
jgi:hypothetical protein